jgi:hypothetical protein
VEEAEEVPRETRGVTSEGASLKTGSSTRMGRNDIAETQNCKIII